MYLKSADAKGFSLGRLIEDLIFLLIVIFNFLDFIHLLPGDIGYIKEVISWSLLAYLVYKVSMVRIFFGCEPDSFVEKRLRIKDKHIDLLIIFTYLLLILKNLVGKAYSDVDEAIYFKPFYEFLITHANTLEHFCFVAGGILLLLISLYCTFRIPIRKPSLLAALGDHGRLDRGELEHTFHHRLARFLGHAVVRFFMIFLLLTGFFVIVFNLIMEWIAVAVDAPMLLLGIAVYIFIVIRHKDKFGAEKFVTKAANFGEEFYEKFISLFRSKDTVLLAISGMLVLHLLTDVAIFIIPYLTGLTDFMYFKHFGSGHIPLPTLLMDDLSISPTLLVKACIALIYFLNVAALFFLLTLPAFVWYEFYRKKGFRFNRFLLALFFAAVICFAYTPVFKITPLLDESLVGVDILTNSVFARISDFSTLYISIIGSFVAFLTVLLASYTKESVKRGFIGILILLIDSFLGLYIYYFASTLIRYYITTIKDLLFSYYAFIAFYLFVFLVITVIFYVGGFLVFLSETKREFRAIW